jgi:hypothetical protein
MYITFAFLQTAKADMGHMTVTPALGRLRQKDQQYEASLGYI